VNLLLGLKLENAELSEEYFQVENSMLRNLLGPTPKITVQRYEILESVEDSSLRLP